MNAWSVQDAKAKFSELLDCCTLEGTQLITKRGVDTAVLIPIEEWKRLTASAKPSLKDLLLTDENRFELDVQRSRPVKRRTLPDLD